jgi:16S rRNA pseudouridine516 synthase
MPKARSPKASSVTLSQMLFSQGFGTRRACDHIASRSVTLVGSDGTHSQVDDPFAEINDWLNDGAVFLIGEKTWRYYERAYVMLHKPTGYECSQKPSAWPPVYELLPSALRLRPSASKSSKIDGVQAIGRLDQDTTGLLLMSDDGAFIHRMSSPKHYVPKVYEVTCKHPITETQIAQLLDGVVLDDDPKPVLAAACVQRSELQLSLTLTEGKYHQVKRMIAAVSNRVEALHRSQIGGLTLGELRSGEWRWLSAAELQALSAAKIDQKPNEIDLY